jgi:PPE-repeat protein
VLDYGMMPPEFNSARMYAGPGSSSMMAAASAWNAVAAELSSAATGYDTVVTQLANDEWLGPASASMAEAAGQHVAWMSTTAGQAEQAANQATAAAAAYETAFNAHVPPPEIAANRAQLANAVSTNVIGQNTPVIAQLEAQYGEMWAQDSAAMYTYAGQSQSAMKVTPFTSPTQNTNPAGSALQSAAVTKAITASPLTDPPTSILSELLSLLPSSLASLFSPSGFTKAFGSLTSAEGTIWNLLFGTSVIPSSLSGLVTAYSPYAAFFYNTEGLPYFSVGMGNFGTQIAKSSGWLGGAAAAAPHVGGLGGLLGGLMGGGAHTAAAVGNAGQVGRLSVPASWAGAAPASAPASPVLVSSVSAAPESGAGGNLLGGMPLAGTAGAGHFGGAGPRYGIKPTVMARPPVGG